MMMSRRRGGGLRVKKKARGFMCGCGGSKAVSISDGSEKQSPMATPPTAATSTPTTTTMSFTTATTTSKGTRRPGKKKMAAAADAASYYAGDTTSDAHSSSVDESTPSLAALLRQLRDLERSVHFLDPLSAGAGADADAANYNTTTTNNNSGGGESGGRRHQRTLSDGGGGGGGASRRVEESVAVVKESADPLGDFRRSMLQMIVENEIVGGAELRELVHRFLSLNSPQHHHIILRAFAEIWEEVFAGYDRTPDFLAAHRRRNRKKPARA